MPSKFKSPYSGPFTTGVKNGTPASTVVWNISKKTNTPTNTIWNSLYKAGLCYRQKFNGTWIYWPSFPVKKSTKWSNHAQTSMWQCFVDWCVSSGWCTPHQFNNWSGNQKQFMTFCRNFFGKQFTGTPNTTARRSTRTRPTPTSTRTRKTSTTSTPWSKTSRPTPKRKPRTTRSPRATSTPWNTVTRNYKFPTVKPRTATRRYVRAA
jgi:hypothetical protein